MQKPGAALKYIESDQAKRSQRMSGLLKDVKMAMSQSGAAPKRYVQKANKGQVVMDRTVSMGSLIDVVRMAMQKPVTALKYVESDQAKRSQRMSGLLKDVKMAMSQSGAAPKRYVQKANK